MNTGGKKVIEIPSDATLVGIGEIRSLFGDNLWGRG